MERSRPDTSGGCGPGSAAGTADRCERGYRFFALGSTGRPLRRRRASEEEEEEDEEELSSSSSRMSSKSGFCCP